MGRHRTIQTGQVEPDLPITPMLDMSFQLLAFFLTTFNPTPSEGHMDLSLPKETGGGPVVPTTPLDEDDEFTIQISATTGGAVEKIEIFDKGATAGDATAGNDPEKLFGILKARRARVGKDGKVRMEIGDALKYQYVVTLLDYCARAGYKSVSPTGVTPAK